MVIDKVYSGIVSRLDEQLSDIGTTLTMSNAFSGRTIASEGWLSVGNAQDFQPATDGSLPDFEEVYYTGYTKAPGTYTSVTVFTGLTRADNTNSTETISDTWSGGTIVGGSLTGDLMSKVPKQEEDLDMNDNSITNVSTLSADTLILSGDYGVRWDQSSSSPDLTRLGSAQGLSAGGNFDSIYPWGGMQRVNLADDGTVNDFYGDTDYIEDGSNGQVMVRIPKFWYKTIKDGTTYEFWISPKPKPGYEIHPAFIRGGQIVDYIYPAAYEAVLYDDSASAYRGEVEIDADDDTYDYSNDIMASVADLQPISGDTDHLDIIEARQLASNRGVGWAQNDFLTATAWQLLAVVEYASFDFQTVLSEGITNLDVGSGNHSQNTGHTSSLGNSSGEVTIAEADLENGATGGDTYACSYRGIENPYGNIWNFTDGIFVKDDGYYIESDPSNWNSDGSGYTHIPTTPINSDGYIDDIDYLTELDYHFFASSTGGSDSTYLCDYQYSHDSGETNIMRLGGYWADGARAGLFCSSLAHDVAPSSRALGSRLEYVG